MEEGTHGYVESEDVSPAGHELKRNEGAALAVGHEAVDFEDKFEFFEVGH